MPESNTNHNLKPLQRNPLILAAVLLIPLVAVAIYIANRPPRDLPNQADDLTLNQRSIERESGGVPRPISDVTANQASKRERSKENFAALVGTTPRLNVNANEATKSLAEAVSTKTHPGRISAMMPPDRFDDQAYRRDPDAYLKIHEPARVWQTAQPGPGVPVLKAVSEHRHRVLQGESVRLQVKTAPDMPVTMTSFDLGSFENGLTSISVAANDQGVAEAVFNASAGTIGEVNVLAGSPAAAEHVRFVVTVRSRQLSSLSAQ